MSLWQAIETSISQAIRAPFSHSHQSALGGGCINATYKIEKSGRAYFIKLNDADKLSMFEAEADGLKEIIDSETIKAPSPLCWGQAAGQSYLVMEYLDLGGRGSGEELGQRLAALHGKTCDRFGWVRGNTIGSTPQNNTPEKDWITFYRDQRLGYQLELAKRKGCGRSLWTKGEELLLRLDAFFDSYSPQPSLLHGDLWSGNYSFTQQGEPVIFDPAVYYGDREADLAMTELFGGFPQSFYLAYEESFPLDTGYPVRKTLYNLYHILNHFNLFGGGYGSQAESMIESLLNEQRA